MPLLTRIMNAIVIPRNTSTETRRLDGKKDDDRGSIPADGSTNVFIDAFHVSSIAIRPVFEDGSNLCHRDLFLVYETASSTLTRESSVVSAISWFELSWHHQPGRLTPWIGANLNHIDVA